MQKTCLVCPKCNGPGVYWVNNGKGEALHRCVACGYAWPTPMPEPPRRSRENTWGRRVGRPPAYGP